MSAGRGAPGPHLDDDAIALLAMTAFFGGPLLVMAVGAGDGMASSAIAVGSLLAVVARAARIVRRRRADDRRAG